MGGFLGGVVEGVSAGLSEIFGNALGGLFGGGGTIGIGEVQAAVESTWTNLLGIADSLFGDIGKVLESIGGVVAAIAKALGHILNDIIHGRLKDLLHQIQLLLHHLHDLIAPLIAWLQKLQKEYNQVMGQNLRKYLDLIQRIRKILVPFRLLHLGFASKLDSYLARFESDLGAKWAGLIAKQNEVIGILNDVMDPRGLLRPGHALGAAGMAIGAISGAIGAADVRQLFCAAPLTTPQPFVEPWAATSTRVLGEIQTSSGDYANQQAQRDITLRSYALDLGTAPLA